MPQFLICKTEITTVELHGVAMKINDKALTTWPGI